MPVSQARSIVLQVGDALTHLHGKGILHRDLKPENILMPTDSLVKVGDFGIAVMQDKAGLLTESVRGMGTVGYVSPEQQYGLKVDERTDQYSLAAALLRALDGATAAGIVPAPVSIESATDRRARRGRSAGIGGRTQEPVHQRPRIRGRPSIRPWLAVAQESQVVAPGYRGLDRDPARPCRAGMDRRARVEARRPRSRRDVRRSTSVADPTACESGPATRAPANRLIRRPKHPSDPRSSSGWSSSAPTRSGSNAAVPRAGGRGGQGKELAGGRTPDSGRGQSPGIHDLGEARSSDGQRPARPSGKRTCEPPKPNCSRRPKKSCVDTPSTSLRAACSSPTATRRGNHAKRGSCTAHEPSRSPFRDQSQPLSRGQ